MTPSERLAQLKAKLAQSNAKLPLESIQKQVNIQSMPIGDVYTQLDPTRLKQALFNNKTGAGAGNYETHPTNNNTNNAANSEIILNEQQQAFVDAVLAGKSACITGAAGTGKTTTIKTAITQMILTGKIPPLESDGHAYLRHGSPGVVCTSFTNKAVSNIKKVLPEDLRNNCITIHKLLEFAPVYIDYETPTGEWKTKREFQPQRNSAKPLPPTIKLLVIDEASMLSVPLWNQLADAIQHTGIQILFIGDIQQLPPIFGKSIYIHVMQRGLESIELTQVYRQALESPILTLAHKILSGKVITAPALPDFSKKTSQGEVILHPWKKQLTWQQAVRQMSVWLPAQIDAGNYKPETDMILTCFNVNFGTEALNNIVATHLARKSNSEVFEIFASYNKYYYRPGDRVLYKKTDAVITKIEKNPRYVGKYPRDPSTTMDYSGNESSKEKMDRYIEDQMGGYAGNGKDIEDVDRILAAFSDHTDEDSPTSRQASHIITVHLVNDDREATIVTAGDYNELSLGYAVTVHKSQGSEYDTVLFITHKSQSNMWFRELLYTAVTRAKKKFVCICEPNTFVQGVTTQKLPGKNLEEKLVNFERYLKLQKGVSTSEEPRLDLLGL